MVGDKYIRINHDFLPLTNPIRPIRTSELLKKNMSPINPEIYANHHSPDKKYKPEIK